MDEGHTPNEFGTSLYHTHTHDNQSKNNTKIGGDFFPAAGGAEFDVAEGRENVRQRGRTGGSNQFEDTAEIARYQCQDHGCHNQGSGEDQVSVRVKWLIREVVSCHDGSADKSLQGQGSQHIQAKAAEKF